MTGWTIGKKLFSAVGVLLAVALAGSGVSAWVVSALNAALDEAIEQSSEVSLTWKVSDAVTALTGLQRDAILAAGTAAQAEQAELDGRARALDGAIAELKTALPNVREQALAQEVAAALHDWQRINLEVVSVARSGDRDAALELAHAKGDPVLARAEARLGELLKGHEEDIAGAEASGERLKMRTAVTQIAIAIVLLVTGAVVVWIVRAVNQSLRAATRELRSGAEQVAAASLQVSTSAQSLSQGATEQAASLEETSASMEEIAAATGQNSEHSREAAEFMRDVHRLVDDFNQVLEALVTSMAGIRESGDKVGKILKTVDEIAFQTNILALNAAVEAARAGEAGMGFAVVADEVRSLSQRSSLAAKNTAELLEQSNAAAHRGVGSVDQAVKAVAEITARVAKVSALVEQVSVGSREQATGIDQVRQAITQLEKVTQAAAASSEEGAAASEELSSQAEATMAVVETLAAMVDARAAERPAALPRTAAAAPRSGAAPLAWRPAPVPRRPASAENVIPLEETGTFGKF